MDNEIMLTCTIALLDAQTIKAERDRRLALLKKKDVDMRAKIWKQYFDDMGNIRGTLSRLNNTCRKPVNF